ncbi:hypothetical protein [Croceibacter atlanticus]|uniref:hypothetical protein n=1 Tax=Croceibacter atlanticus TaxID=313588 RepID=UPI0030DAFA20|tara:strand:+ start:2278 stop:2457 length:180 start_codon:yes stop_codon:yes gene_type:complete
MQDNQALQDIINELPDTFINKVMQETIVANLTALRDIHTCYNRRAVINARIERLNWLAP